LLEGKNVNLRLVEKEDLSLLVKWLNDPNFRGEFMRLMQVSREEEERYYANLPSGNKFFFIEKKDGSKVGMIWHYEEGGLPGIGYALVPSERGKGYGTEAVKIIVDYLFLSKEIIRIEAETDVRNVASQRILEKSGFTKEGTIRKSKFVRGEWRDRYLYSILREEWKEPKILTKTA
jgi:diamine N-acetyltransferase